MYKQVKLYYKIAVIPLGTPDAFKSRGMLVIKLQTAATCFCVDSCLVASGILLYGIKGMGKSLLAQAVVDMSRGHVVSIAFQQALLWYRSRVTFR